ncbi:sugar phosphate isomerase/epimerase family protein [Phycisphaera mikurensis]|uniref:Xylose isomerase-like TIM barrel domain-containing protein n=1 Tax=Phycisphaera mikurensis (strain NBRC 102666 / KCTC 22515 / FYK2301M01) TaxID=1142394 RepID=I0IDY2_PHYMF|nr:sugar phosphate isomerase/epimerase family protein [Phycisphaera mikurensis]MBB6441277.1 sugar phosphate isomerase/epimerase [Phycisphaera mikurensis]BAM03470.1 hypothetical protein PSMK_13110 [Phycisphaera mikurensis NBRC 102666]
MRLAICSWSLQATSPADLVEKVRATGIPRVQLRLDDVAEDPAWADAPAALREGGVELVSGMMQTRGEDYSTLDTIRVTGGLLPDEHWEHNRDTAARVADLAAGLGLPSVSLHAGFLPHDAADAADHPLTRRTGAVADLFADRGLDLLLETGQEDAATLDRFLDAADRPNLFLNFDPANMILYGMGDPLAALRTLLPRVKQAHAKDAVPAAEPGTWGTEVPVGEGAVDWAAFLEILRGGGYDGELILEREAGDARVDDLRAGAAELRPLMRPA